MFAHNRLRNAWQRWNHLSVSSPVRASLGRLLALPCFEDEDRFVEAQTFLTELPREDVSWWLARHVFGPPDEPASAERFIRHALLRELVPLVEPEIDLT